MGRFFLAITTVLLLASCHRTSDPLIGRWTVEKVNVEFNENIATPQMVQMWGEIEKSNVVEISQDSVLTFISDGDTLVGRCSFRGQKLYRDGVVFGVLKGKQIITEENTPLGKVTVYYRK